MYMEAIDWYKQCLFLDERIRGAVISKIYMPTPRSLLLEMYKKSPVLLLCNLEGNGPALYIPDKLPEIPDSPPAFCMLLRKNFEESRIESLRQKNFDRVLVLRTNSLDKGGMICCKELIFELTGHNSNIIFIRDGIITDCLKHIGTKNNRLRLILPGQNYTPPPSKSRLHPLSVEAEKLVQAIMSDSHELLEDKILNTVQGIGYKTAHALAVAPILSDAIRQLQENCGASFDDTLNRYINTEMNKISLQIPEQGRLQGIVKGEITKTLHRLHGIKEDMAKAENADHQRIIADTLMANICKVKKGSKKIFLDSIYDNSPLEIQLNPELSPTANGENYYKKYNKFKRARTELKNQLELAGNKLAYLESIAVALNISSTKAELAEIAAELVNAGIIKEKSKKNKSAPASQPLHLHLINADIYVGKNNRQNDYVTFKLAKPGDLWFHTKDIPGSHVLLQGEVNEENIRRAQMLAAYFSKARQGSNIPVDMVEKKYVKKPSGAVPGFVIFTHNKTSYINIDENEISALLHV